MDAMSCGAVVLGSRHRRRCEEMIRDGENGLLADFFDADATSRPRRSRCCKDPAAFRPLGRAAEQMIVERYSLEAVLPRDAADVRARLRRPPRSGGSPRARPRGNADAFDEDEEGVAISWMRDAVLLRLVEPAN